GLASLPACGGGVGGGRKASLPPRGGGLGWGPDGWHYRTSQPVLELRVPELVEGADLAQEAQPVGVVEEAHQAPGEPAPERQPAEGDEEGEPGPAQPEDERRQAPGQAEDQSGSEVAGERSRPDSPNSSGM